MTLLMNETDIEHTKGDTFICEITKEDGSYFDDDCSLEFVIAKNFHRTPILKKSLSPVDGTFLISLSSTETEEFDLGDYIYKLVITLADKTVITQTSGKFKVKWGA